MTKNIKLVISHRIFSSSTCTKTRFRLGRSSALDSAGGVYDAPQTPWSAGEGDTPPIPLPRYRLIELVLRPHQHRFLSTPMVSNGCRKVTDFCTLRVLTRTFMPAFFSWPVTSWKCPGDTIIVTSLPTCSENDQKSVYRHAMPCSHLNTRTLLVSLYAISGLFK